LHIRAPKQLQIMESLPTIPAKRYFTIGEVAELCAVKPHVLRYWEQEFTQLRPVKRRGNRRYYQHHEVLIIRRIRSLLYEQGFTISGARIHLQGTRQTIAAAESQAAPAALDLRAELLAIRNLLAVDCQPKIEMSPFAPNRNVPLIDGFQGQLRTPPGCAGRSP